MDEQVGRETRAPDEPVIRRTAIHRDPAAKGGFVGRALFLLILLIAAGGVYWHYFRPASAPRRPPASPPQAIRDAEIGKHDIRIIQNALGAVTPLATVVVRAQIPGQLQKLGFKEGQMVKQGDFLAQIDPRPYQVALEQAQGTLQKDQALLEQSKTDLARYQTLNRQDSIARQQVDTQASLVRQYQASIVSDNAQVDSAKLNLTYCAITSPVSGRVGLRQVDVGNYVQLSDTNGIVTITQLEPISVTFSIPEDNVPAVMKRLRAGATLPVAAFNRANTEQIAAGALRTVDNQVDTTTGTVKLRADFDNKDDALFPQQFVNVQLLVDTLKDQVAAPVAAVQRGASGSFVFVVANGTVKAQPVTIGPQDDGFIAVETGLEVGQHVVIDGADRLRDGAKVEVRNNAAPLPAAGSAPNGPAPTGRQGGGAGSGRRRGAPGQDSTQP